MNPTNSSPGGDAVGPVGSGTPQDSLQTTHQAPQAQGHQAVAANVIRSQIDALYDGHSVPQNTQQNTQQTIQPAEQQAPNPYERTHTDHPQPQAEQWKAYHSAWQNYYQKYYEAYYEHKRSQEQAEQAQQTPPADQTSYFNGQQAEQPTPQPQAEQFDDDATKDEALYELRQKLLGRVQQQAKKVRGSKHFIPIAAALGVVLIFVFLQYNRVFLATVNAYVSPGSIDPQNIVIDPSAGTKVSGDPRLVIPKINVDVPAIYGVGADHDSQMKAMEKGVAHFAIPGANSHPGEIGNTVLSGHSSNDLFDAGDHKFIFAQLEKMTKGDTIYANYKGTRYTYVVTKTEVVLPTQVKKLIYPTNKPILTLITCTPLGTAEKRLLVTAEQISPDPAAAAKAPQGSGSEGSEDTAIPGNSPTFLERIFGAR